MIRRLVSGGLGRPVELWLGFQSRHMILAGRLFGWPVIQPARFSIGQAGQLSGVPFWQILWLASSPVGLFSGWLAFWLASWAGWLALASSSAGWVSGWPDWLAIRSPLKVDI